MAYLFLIGAVLCNALSSIFGKAYNLKTAGNKGASSIYNLFQMLGSLVVWCIIFFVEFKFEVSVLPYALLFAAFFTISLIGVINALKTGLVALTTLMISLSLILTTIWGFIFWSAPITPIVIIGLLLVVVAIILCLYVKNTDGKKFSVKWLIFILMAFFGNAGCTIAQRTQQIAFDGQYGGMLMMFASLFSLVACFVFYLIGDKSETKVILNKSWYIPISSGIGNALLNYFVILLASSTLSPSLIYPVIGVGSLAIVIITSRYIFKEKLKIYQYVGILIGAVATVLLSI